MRYAPVFVLAFVTACGPSPPTLSNAQTSPEALARELLVAFAQGDHARLRALALTEEEFRTHVWPELPVARPERNVPFSYVWGDLRQKSEASLVNLVARFGGRAFELAAVRFEGPTTDYGAYEVRRQAVFSARGPNGPVDLQLCGSMLHKDGQWKVFSYVVDD